ncbi:hypothetical protein GAGA_0893 [Paraglaciecola agarilytica NO2]|uniref:Uncharacterized protein n=1 Tax=Paraglaciecola agarilytica NO2 TaxID=1125747 RepID=A0ABQ0I375_9ALTE|nr:hypothetical protein GAGA_0893 [Paraglaciecola agarilytica NO2]
MNLNNGTNFLCRNADLNSKTLSVLASWNHLELDLIKAK